MRAAVCPCRPCGCCCASCAGGGSVTCPISPAPVPPSTMVHLPSAKHTPPAAGIVCSSTRHVLFAGSYTPVRRRTYPGRPPHIELAAHHEEDLAVHRATDRHARSCTLPHRPHYNSTPHLTLVKPSFNSAISASPKRLPTVTHATGALHFSLAQLLSVRARGSSTVAEERGCR